MEIGVWILWHIIVEDYVDLLDIDTSTEDVGWDHDSVLELLEFIVSLDSLFLREISMNADRGEVILLKNLIKLDCEEDALDEDDNLVEHKGVQQISQLSDFLVFFKFHVVLLESVKSQFTLVINENFERILHELSAYSFDLIWHGGRKHHDLLAVWGILENFLNITSHV